MTNFEKIVALIEFYGPLPATKINTLMRRPPEFARQTIGNARRKGDRTLRICNWVPPEGPGQWTPVWAIGDRPDKPRPKASTRAEINRAYRRRKKQPKPQPATWFAIITTENP